MTLDQSTLFYWTLSDTSLHKRQNKDAIKDWASGVPVSAQPVSRAPSHTTQTKSIAGRSAIPSLTSGTSRSSAPSVLTNNVRIVGHRIRPDSAKVKPEPEPEHGGGLSDYDETKGNEREAAINSPPKGKKRVTSEVSVSFLLSNNYLCNLIPIQQLVIKKPKTGETTKKARTEELPGWIDQKWFRQVFVTSYMAFVGQTADPWDVPIKQAVKVMQKIWDATTDIEYEITSSSAVCHKVCDRFFSNIILISILCNRPFNASPTRGETLSAPPPLRTFWLFLTPKRTCRILMTNAKNFVSITLKNFVFCTKISKIQTKRHVNPHIVLLSPPILLIIT